MIFEMFSCSFCSMFHLSPNPEDFVLTKRTQSMLWGKDLLDGRQSRSSAGHVAGALESKETMPHAHSCLCTQELPA